MVVHSIDTSQPAPTILFVCLHGSAKSLIAAMHLNRLADARGVPWRGESSGLEADAEVPDGVIDGLAGDGIDVRGYRPRQLTPEHLETASRVVGLSCDLLPPARDGVIMELWDDLPLVSDGYGPARDAIVARVTSLLDRLELDGH